MFDIPCVIFAGGKSSRMGEDKALLPFGDFNTLTEFQLNKLSKLFKNVYISCKTKDKFNFSADFIEDVKTDNVFAPTAGFIAVYEKLQCERFFAISVDTPFVDADVINKLLDADTADADADATIAKTDKGMQPMCGIYHKSMHPEFIQMLKEDNHKLGFLLKNSKTNFVYFKNDKTFLNLNNPKEYEQALKLIHNTVI
ncbi:molybdenum cofactor guanylyltransferase MobA [Sulfurimonas lithotrophica]|uniref:Probable molybdenum cofactor guanylyltransferase n=1 Tax=Sulfurimonas lithotrophica TaxID=2590022 RepID=A0A5P8NXY1_9BACT|nr:molybdenum cofactor guanylyltransferase MobA [Sulfurimonas lithotrophica]QFR48266.1 molybdenum cofactor guanylyltransferase MobA [Sulfurimonas lithotrophica]